MYAFIPSAKNAPTACYDEDGNPLLVGQKVAFLDRQGEITFEAGAYGISFDSPIDWDEFGHAMEKDMAGRGTARIMACFNDNFVSLWEIIWNFNGEDDGVPHVKIIES